MPITTYNPNFINQFAKKFLNDHAGINPIPSEKLTEQYLKHHFKDCAIPVRKDMMPQLRQTIKSMQKNIQQEKGNVQ